MLDCMYQIILSFNKNYMTKIELVTENKLLKAEIKEFKDKVNEAIKLILITYCSEAIEPVQAFCDELELDFPKHKISLLIPCGSHIVEIYDDNGNTIEFDTLLETVI